MTDKPQLRFHPRAKDDIAEILIYLRAEASPTVSRQFLEALDKTTNRLREHPHLGSHRTFTSPLLRHIRMIPISDFSRHLLFYLSDQDCIDVIRVVHGARDLPALFDE
ncbi:MAG: type II toxin-antitoxin system RelE/ParE family toxin [Gammaproteobacteria bacterium]